VCFSCVGTVIGHFYICPAGGSLLAAHYTWSIANCCQLQW
jgi:hypothetical protein